MVCVCFVIFVVSNHYALVRSNRQTLCVDVFDSACPVHVSGWWMPLINRIVVRLRFLISILICTYGYLRVSSASLSKLIFYILPSKYFPTTVLVLHLADDGFAFV